MVSEKPGDDDDGRREIRRLRLGRRRIKSLHRSNNGLHHLGLVRGVGSQSRDTDRIIGGLVCVCEGH